MRAVQLPSRGFSAVNVFCELINTVLRGARLVTSPPRCTFSRNEIGHRHDGSAVEQNKSSGSVGDARQSPPLRQPSQRNQTQRIENNLRNKNQLVKWRLQPGRQQQ